MTINEGQFDKEIRNHGILDAVDCVLNKRISLIYRSTIVSAPILKGELEKASHETEHGAFERIIDRSNIIRGEDKTLG